MHKCMYMHIYIYIHTYICMYVYVYIYVCIYIYTFHQLCRHAHAYVYAYIFVLLLQIITAQTNYTCYSHIRMYTTAMVTHVVHEPAYSAQPAGRFLSYQGVYHSLKRA